MLKVEDGNASDIIMFTPKLNKFHFSISIAYFREFRIYVNVKRLILPKIIIYSNAILFVPYYLFNANWVTWKFDGKCIHVATTHLRRQTLNTYSISTFQIDRELAVIISDPSLNQQQNNNAFENVLIASFYWLCNRSLIFKFDQLFNSLLYLRINVSMANVTYSVWPTVLWNVRTYIVCTTMR